MNEQNEQDKIRAVSDGLHAYGIAWLRCCGCTIPMLILLLLFVYLVWKL